jgi:hypothetical protein
MTSLRWARAVFKAGQRSTIAGRSFLRGFMKAYANLLEDTVMQTAQRRALAIC